MPKALLVAGALLVFGLCSLAADVSSCLGSSSHTMSEDVSTVNRFISAVRAVRDAHELNRYVFVRQLADIMSFPLERWYPLPSINSAREFMTRYAEVFDDEFIRIIVESDENECGHIGWRGLQMHNGLVWFAHANVVGSINYESDAEKQERIRLVEVERNQLHESLREYDYPVLEWETCTYRIRIDRRTDGTYRYASWRVEESHASKPDIVVNGQVCCGGTEGPHTYAFVFQNGEHKYVLNPYMGNGYHLQVYRTDLTDPSEIMSSGELLLTEPVVNAGKTGWYRGKGWYTRISACQ